MFCFFVFVDEKKIENEKPKPDKILYVFVLYIYVYNSNPFWVKKNKKKITEKLYIFFHLFILVMFDGVWRYFLFFSQLYIVYS